MKNVIVVMLAGLLFLCCKDAYTDVLYLKNGVQHQGYVVQEDEEKVIFRIGTEEDCIDVKFLSEEVLRIDQVGAQRVIQLPAKEGPGIAMPRPVILDQPLFSNVTRPITVNPLLLQGKKSYAVDGENISALSRQGLADNQTE